MGTKRKARFEIYPELNSKPTRYRWRLQTSNNRIIADGGEGYSSVSAAKKAIVRMTELLYDSENVLVVLL